MSDDYAPDDAFCPGKPGQFSNSDLKTAENFGIDYLDVEEFVDIYGKNDSEELSDFESSLFTALVMHGRNI